jgi:hypothetical protein
MTRQPLPDSVAQWLPHAQFCETHASPISGEANRILDAVEALDDRDDVVIRTMLQLREAPSRLIGYLGGRSAIVGKRRFGLHSFTRLERTATRVTFGLVGRFWRLDFGLHELPTPDSFAAPDALFVPRLVMIYDITLDDQGRQCLVTHTAVSCPDRRSRLLFTPYWIAIRLASGMIRKRLLGIVRRKVDMRGHLPPNTGTSVSETTLP